MSYEQLPATERDLVDLVAAVKGGSSVQVMVLVPLAFWREGGDVLAEFTREVEDRDGSRHPQGRSRRTFNVTRLVHHQQQEGLTDQELLVLMGLASPARPKPLPWCLCLVCRRASLSPEWDTPEYPIQRPQGFGLPSGGRCPYDGCEARIQQSLSWRDVRHFEADLPERPKRDVVYPRTRDYIYAIMP